MERLSSEESPAPHGRFRQNFSRYAVASPEKFLSYACTIVGDGLIDRDTTAGAHEPGPNKFGGAGHAPNSSRIQHKASAETERATEATGGAGTKPGKAAGRDGVPSDMKSGDRRAGRTTCREDRH